MGKKVIITMAVLLLNIAVSIGQEADVIPMDSAYKRIYNIHSILSDQLPKIDGKLDDEVWQHVGSWTQDFVQTQPFERRPTNYITRAKIFCDNKYIYVVSLRKPYNRLSINSQNTV